MEKYFAELSRTNVFNGLNEQEIDNLLQDKPFRIKEFSREEYVAYSQDLCNDLHLPVHSPSWLIKEFYKQKEERLLY